MAKTEPEIIQQNWADLLSTASNFIIRAISGSEPILLNMTPGRFSHLAGALVVAPVEVHAVLEPSNNLHLDLVLGVVKPCILRLKVSHGELARHTRGKTRPDRVRPGAVSRTRTSTGQRVKDIIP